MKKVKLLVIALVITSTVSAQGIFEFKVFPEIHFGFFNPEDVNAYIENDLSNYSIVAGTSDMILNFNLGLGFGLRFFNLVEAQPIFEYSIAPKIISGADHNYSYSKFSGGMMANFLIPMSPTKKNSIIIGAGLFYNSMTFEDFSGSSMNPRFQTGISLNNNRFNPQVILAYDMAKATDDEFEGFELDYSSFRIGVNLNF